ncbi:MAG TPA: Uma2 family endonuclease, partial [Bryobacteraceae bacterium]|nr:Uma2 family endonuclease [Bryobacteraceae bacterium]
MSESMANVEGYLSHTYEPDREFLNGIPLERSPATILHSLLQGILVAFLKDRCENALVLPEARLRIAPDRYRIPDVMVLERPIKPGKVVEDVPAVTIEIMSPDDTFEQVLEKCNEYQALGVRHIVLMDPEHSRHYVFASAPMRDVPAALCVMPAVKIALRHCQFEIPPSIFD